MATTSGSDKSATAGETRPATFSERFLALLVDWVLCLMLAVAFMPKPYGNLWTSAFLVVEYGVFIGFFAQTPGMRVAKIRCVRVTDGGRIGLWRALVRGAMVALVVPALIMDANKRGLQDRAAESIVLR